MSNPHPDVLSDDLALFNSRLDMEDEIIKEAFFDYTKGKRNWRAICLTNYATSDKVGQHALDGVRLPVKLKILDTMENIVPDPCRMIWTDEQTKRVISLFPLAYSAQPYENRYLLPSFGQVVNVSFNENGPAEHGRHRGVQFSFVANRNSQQYDCQNRKFIGGIQTFGRGLERLGNLTSPGRISNGKNIKGAINLTWEQLKKLSKLGLFQPLIDNIQKYESGGDPYNAYNVQAYIIRNKGESKTDALVRQWGKKLTEFTIQEMLDKVTKVPKIYASKKGVKSLRSVRASGKYQMMPSVLEDAVDRIKGCNTGELYGPEQQEAFGVYLILTKRPTLGKYLFGDKSITAAKAQLRMAQEWAGVRIIKAVKQQKQYGGKNLVPGDSYYKGYGGNPDDTNLAKARATAAAIEATRQSIDKSPEAQQVLKDLGIK